MTVIVPQSYIEFENEIMHQVHLFVKSRSLGPDSRPMRREQSLVPNNSSLTSVWRLIAPHRGQRVSINANFISNQRRIVRIDFSVPLELVQARGVEMRLELGEGSVERRDIHPIRQSPTNDAFTIDIDIPVTRFERGGFKAAFSGGGIINVSIDPTIPASAETNNLRLEVAGREATSNSRDLSVRLSFREQVEFEISEAIRFRLYHTTRLWEIYPPDIFGRLKHAFGASIGTDSFQVAFDTGDLPDYFIRFEWFFPLHQPVNRYRVRIESTNFRVRVRIGLTLEALRRWGRTLLIQLRSLALRGVAAISAAFLARLAILVVAIGLTAITTYVFLRGLREIRSEGTRHRLCNLYAQGYLAIVFSSNVVDPRLSGILLRAKEYGETDAQNDIQERGIVSVKQWVGGLMQRNTISNDEFRQESIQVIRALGDYLFSGGLPLSRLRY